MNILRLIFELFVIYIVYKLIFDFIVPIYRTTREVKSKVDEMNQRMENQRNNAGYTNANPAQPKQKSEYTPASEDYIDYEEIKS